LILIGIVFGLLFRSLATLMQRLIDPNEFMVLQDKLFATFNAPSLQLLLVSAVVLVVVLVAVWRITDVFDAMALGRDASIGLGVEYRKMVLLTLGVISVLVSVSTALVGPVTFFGLLVANLAYQLFDTYRHRVLLPAAALLGVILLVVGQFVLERVFSFQTALGIVIEFLGGVVFIVLVLRGNVR
jgi:iron complex transport system permease protein